MLDGCDGFYLEYFMKRLLLAAGIVFCAGCAPILVDRAMSGTPRAAGGHSAPGVQGEWRVTAIGSALIPAANAPTVQIADNRVAGRTGCNSYSAPLQAGGERFSVGNAVSTRMACGDRIMQQEHRFLRAL